MKAPLKATAGGLAVLSVCLAFLATEGGVFAAEGASSVDVATASKKVSAAADMIALAASSAAPVQDGQAAAVRPVPQSMAAPAPDVVPEAPRTTDVAEPAASEADTVAAIEPDVRPTTPPPEATVPTPVAKPSMSTPPARTVAVAPLGPGRAGARPAAERKRNVARRSGVRTIRVADEDLADGRPRRFLSIPIPIVLGAYR